jgi:hypothetical protein
MAQIEAFEETSGNRKVSWAINFPVEQWAVPPAFDYSKSFSVTDKDSHNIVILSLSLCLIHGPLSSSSSNYSGVATLNSTNHEYLVEPDQMLNSIIVYYCRG